MYSAFKKGIRNLSLIPGTPKCPTSFAAATDDKINDFSKSLLNLMTSKKKKYSPKTWWSADVISLLLALHLQHLAPFAAGEQSLDWMQEKGLEAKTKFECDQKNREAEIKRKRMKEEEEQDKAARNQKAVAESSTKLTDTLAAFISNRGNDDAGIEAK
jgi:dipeptidase